MEASAPRGRPARPRRRRADPARAPPPKEAHTDARGSCRRSRRRRRRRPRRQPEKAPQKTPGGRSRHRRGRPAPAQDVPQGDESALRVRARSPRRSAAGIPRSAGTAPPSRRRSKRRGRSRFSKTPPAPRRSWCTFDIARDGATRNIRIVQSSGIPSLDRSAQRAVDRGLAASRRSPRPGPRPRSRSPCASISPRRLDEGRLGELSVLLAWQGEPPEKPGGITGVISGSGFTKIKIAIPDPTAIALAQGPGEGDRADHQGRSRLQRLFRRHRSVALPARVHLQGEQASGQVGEPRGGRRRDLDARGCLRPRRSALPPLQHRSPRPPSSTGGSEARRTSPAGWLTRSRTTSSSS